MASQGKSIVMLMDNASSHDIPSVSATEQHGLQTIKLTNVLVVFLPANTTSHVKPLDAGIIAAFKAHYKAHCIDQSRPFLQCCMHASLQSSPAGAAHDHRNRLAYINKSMSSQH